MNLFEEAIVNFNKGDYAAALNLDIKALEKAQKEKDCLLEAYATHQIGKMQYYLKDRRLALGWMLKALDLSQSCHVDSIERRVLHNIGSIYQELNQPDSSLFYYTKAKALLDQTKDWGQLTTLYGVMGELCHRALNKDKEAAEYIDLCEKYARLAGDTGKIAFSFMKRGNLATYHRDFKKAEEYYTVAKTLYTKASQVEGEMYALICIGMAKSMQSDTSIYKIYMQLNRMKDSIFRTGTAQKVAEYKTLYETEKAKAESRELAKINERKNSLLLGIGLIAVALLTILWFAYSRYKIKKENELEKQKNYLRTQSYKEVVAAEENERSRIARDLHDGLGQLLSATRMNVSVVKSIYENDSKQLSTSLQLLDKAVKEVRSISHNLMPASLTNTGLSAALYEMAQSLSASAEFKMEVVIEEGLSLPASSEIGIYRLIQEIINNVIRHSQATRVDLTLGSEAGNNFIEIRDNGTGFDTNKIQQSKGIGWKNIFSRVELLNGKIQIDSKEGIGTTIYITFGKIPFF